MLLRIGLYGALLSALVIVSASSSAHATTGGIDTAGTLDLPFAVGGTQVMDMNASGLAFTQGGVSTTVYAAIGNIGANGCNAAYSSLHLSSSTIWDNCDGNLHLAPGGGVNNAIIIPGNITIDQGWNQAVTINSNQIWKSGTAGDSTLYVQYSNPGGAVLIGGQAGKRNDLIVQGYVDIRSVNGEGGTIQLEGTNGVNIWLENLNGKFRVLNNPWNAELFTVDQSGNVSATAFFQISDARLKTNIRTSEGLGVINHLRGVSFDWKDGHGSSVGVLAQDVERVIPTAVHTASDGHKTVEYSQLIGPMIESIKELEAKVDRLEAENVKLRKAINP